MMWQAFGSYITCRKVSSPAWPGSFDAKPARKPQPGREARQAAARRRRRNWTAEETVLIASTAQQGNPNPMEAGGSARPGPDPSRNSVA
eukprot:CAMPEP_0204368908 /NCGR_PEP_ID=MMETSP0469-20131031/44562_1 /ASSEMBLY_ACC=CAM_ASM_000384 /TAXON_ID=2969 /ORGANISM="Oxyrrhis marina" /LENGTH=88 /DNA_ID=CAMNT_0051358545 /DNA_START=861 /DNA_END=1126 /DNA_ORIENTATION=-